MEYESTQGLVLSYHITIMVLHVFAGYMLWINSNCTHRTFSVINGAKAHITIFYVKKYNDVVMSLLHPQNSPRFTTPSVTTWKPHSMEPMLKEQQQEACIARSSWYCGSLERWSMKKWDIIIRIFPFWQIRFRLLGHHYFLLEIFGNS